MAMMDQKLRNDRLVFYEKDVARIDEEIDGLLELSGSRCAFLIDRDGHLVTRRGDAVQSSLESIAALVAGSFAATREMARLLGEDEFATLFHQGERESIQISLVGERALLAMVFDQRTNLGMVRYYAVESVRRLSEILEEIGKRETPAQGGLASDFSSSAAAALDRLF
ncbi:MAG: roadblock/LC7 domain-containing protein [Planctomycetes bacterium]|nr:roadblock/LC7 domain-containing protein [Planctomycetota bacterium]